MAKRKNITCVKYNDSDRYGWVSHSTAGKLIDDGKAIEWNPKKNEPEHAKKPTISNTKDEITGYLVENDIAHNSDQTKSELLELI